MSISGALNTASQVLINNGTNISYGVRAAARNGTTPTDRRLDYNFRDLYMSAFMTVAFELCFRTMDTLYTTPLLAKQLQLNMLAKLYEAKLKPQLGSKLTDINYNTLPPVLRDRLVGALVKDKSHYLVPALLEKDLQAQLQSSDPVLKAQAETLLEHIYRRMDYPTYLKRYKKHQFSPAEMDLINEKVNDIHVPVNQELENLTGEAKTLREKYRRFIAPPEVAKEKVRELKNEVLAKIPQHLEEAVRDGWRSRRTLYEMGKICRSAGWPKLTFNLLANILYFGVFANWFDLNVLQPWQKKVADERGGVQDLVAPAYQALIPGALVAGLLGWRKVAAKSYIGRYAVPALAGLATYTAASVIFVKARLNWLRKNRPVYKPSMPVKPQAKGIQQPSNQRAAQTSPNSTTPRLTDSPLQHNGFQQFR